MESCDVLIVGGGPIGLALGCELGRRGVNSLLIEAKAGLHDHPRSTVLGPRTMEIFRSWGLANTVIGNGLPMDFPVDVVFTDRLAGHEICRLQYPSKRRVLERAPEIVATYVPLQWSPYAKIIIGQQDLEPLLYAQLQTYPSCRSIFQSELTACSQDADGVTAVVRSPGGSESNIRAKYLVACDGGRSTARRSLGSRMTGANKIAESIGIFFRSKRLLDAIGKPPGFLMWSLARGVNGSFIAINGRDLWMHQRYLLPHEKYEEIDVMAALRGAIGADVDIEVISQWHWAPRELVAEDYRCDRIFLAGDAAHLMSPTGGMGLNTGVGDIYNLAWKLDAVLAGWGGPGLLASYTPERRQVAIRNGEESTHNRRIMQDTMIAGADSSRPGDDGERSREKVASMLPLHRKHFDAVGCYLGDDYYDSPVIVRDGTMLPPHDALVYHARARPGSRLPHFWVDEKHSILDLLGKGFTLLTAAPAELDSLVAEFSRRRVPLSVVVQPAIEMTRYEARHVLVRPDGHVAWRGDSAPDAYGVLTHVTGHQPAEARTCT